MTAIHSAMISNSLPLPESVGDTHSPANRSGFHDPISVAQDFESVFATMLLKEMRQSLEPGSLFGQDSGDVYGGMFDRFLGQELTKGRGLGMAPMITEGIERQQRSANPHAATHANTAPKIAG